MAVPLPSWADEVESVLRKAERYRDMTPDERGAHMAAACRANVTLLRGRTDAARVLAWVDPPPASTVAALARLRALVVAR